MAAHIFAASSIFALKFNKCDHIEERQLLKSVEDRSTIRDIFEQEHGDAQKHYELSVKTSSDGHTSFEVNPNFTIAEINKEFRMKYLYFTCTKTSEDLTEMVGKAVEAANKTN